jgi:AcrR family transcriptional regulator
MGSGPRETSETGNVRDRLVDAGLRVLAQDGPNLTVRRIAKAADTSTMGVYTCFGGRTGMLEAIYERGFELLREALSTVAPRIPDLGLAYRRFALANPALYAFMFERPLPDFDPSPALRRAALNTTFGILVDAVRAEIEAGTLRQDDPVHASYLIWSVTHGLVSLELTHAVRSPLPGWFIDTPEAGEKVLLDGITTVLSGLK